MNKRGVYFFVIDAFIGGAIIIISLMVVLHSYIYHAEKESPITILEDFSVYLQNTEARDFEGNYTNFLLHNTSNITRPENTLFEQISEFHHGNKNLILSNFTREIIAYTLPPQMSVAFYYDNVQIYERAVFPKENSNLVLSSKKIAMVTINETFVYGPHIVEVVLWT